ncbi:hypothetical protein ABIQ69_11500 [Agromyces sp. G08B096]|uniref:Scaffolding protein n=1 Tax=Agromyces sp. G08B096 TaxID=3156399 RepID=A0AAU7W3G2_9MICO
MSEQASNTQHDLIDISTYADAEPVYMPGPARPSKLALMGIRFMTDEGDGTGAGDPPTDPPSSSTPPWGDDPSKFDPDKAWKLIQNVKGDLVEERTKREQAIKDAVEQAQKSTLAEFAKLLTGGEPEETDPEKLKARVTDLSTQIQSKDGELTKAQADVKAANLSTAVALLAPSLGGNAKLLLANEEFKTSIASAEPTDEAAITAAITKALQANAALKQPPARSGAGEHTGPTVQSLEAQLKAATEKGEWRETIRLKRAIAAAKTATGN